LERDRKICGFNVNEVLGICCRTNILREVNIGTVDGVKCKLVSEDQEGCGPPMFGFRIDRFDIKRRESSEEYDWFNAPIRISVGNMGGRIMWTNASRCYIVLRGENGIQLKCIGHGSF
jgi:hypothetical protein